MSKNQALIATPLGGLGEIGMNLMVYECNGRLLVVDMGISFPSVEEAPGAEIVLPDITWLRANKDRVDGIIITHAHEDHIGAVNYLWEDIGAPVYVSRFASIILEHKLREFQLEGRVPVFEVRPRAPFQVGPFKLEFVNLVHSIPESHGVLIDTPHGRIFHTGDYKMDENPVIGAPADIERLKQIGDEGVLALFGDSTNIFRPGHSGTENAVSESLEAIVKSRQNRIYFCTFSSNIGRLKVAIDIALKANRKVAIWGRSMQKMLRAAYDCGYLDGKLYNNIISAEEAAKLPRGEVMFLLTGAQAEHRSALTRLSHEALNLPLVEGDTVLLSSKIIPGNERPILDMINRLIRRGADVVHEWNAFVHVSGHGAQDEIKQMYELVRPQLVVPAHGEIQHLRAHAAFARKIGVPNSLVLENGQRLQLAPGTPKILDETVPIGRYYVDGLNILDDDRFVLKERRKMANEGLAVVTVVADKRKNIMGTPQVTTRGLIDETLQPELIQRAEKAAAKALFATCRGDMIDNPEKAREAMRLAVRRLFIDQRGKKPVVVAQIITVKA